MFKLPFQNVCSGNLCQINSKNATSRSRVTKHLLNKCVSPATRNFSAAEEPQWSCVCELGRGKVFIYEYYQCITSCSSVVSLYTDLRLLKIQLKIRVWWQVCEMLSGFGNAIIKCTIWLLNSSSCLQAIKHRLSR